MKVRFQELPLQYPVLSTSSPNDGEGVIAAYTEVFGDRHEGELNIAFAHWLAACELFAQSTDHAAALEHLRNVRAFAEKYDEPKPLADIAGLLAAHDYELEVLNTPNPEFAGVGTELRRSLEPTT